MKYFLNYIFLSVVFCIYTTVKSEDIASIENKDLYSANEHNNFGDTSNKKRSVYATDYHDINETRYTFGFDDGNPDVHGIIERPCQAYDKFCIRKFLADHSTCRISGREVPDPFIRQQSTFNFASANVSFTAVDSVFERHDARVEEFYINRATDNLVIAFSYDSITWSSNNTYLKYYRRGREPIVTVAFGRITFFELTTTMVIPGLDNLRIDRAEIYTYGERPSYPFEFGTGANPSSDAETSAMYTYLTTEGVPLERYELINTEGIFFGATYLQYNLCDFGLKVL